ncbi:MAG: HIT domain-containing protein [Thermovirgaceae bacterium]|nr:HIT domain-containing protein [Thermovirgaceae bacterium]
MDQMFAPWRMAYIDSADRQEDCIFCDFPKENKDRERLILARGEKVFVILNAFPYNPGHLMVAPFRHEGEYEQLHEDEFVEMHRFGQRCVGVLKKAMNPQGFNMGINIGKIAGAGFAGHLHLHIVPRWNGDTNFMPVVGETKVLPETLHETWEKLKKAWEAHVR